MQSNVFRSLGIDERQDRVSLYVRQAAPYQTNFSIRVSAAIMKPDKTFEFVASTESFRCKIADELLSQIYILDDDGKTS